MMTGTEIGKLSQQFDLGNPLTDAELKQLIQGIQFIFDFCFESRLSPLTVYYGMKLEELKRCQEARQSK